jgi:hypothetical protein
MLRGDTRCVYIYKDFNEQYYHGCTSTRATDARLSNVIDLGGRTAGIKVRNITRQSNKFNKSRLEY